jgi:hypothetical protein
VIQQQGAFVIALERPSRIRTQHPLKTFRLGWFDRQLADDTVIVTTPAAHVYSTKPGSSLFFPSWAINTPATTPTAINEHRAMMMPPRKQSRATARTERVNAERALNDAHVAERNRPPPF